MYLQHHNRTPGANQKSCVSHSGIGRGRSRVRSAGLLRDVARDVLARRSDLPRRAVPAIVAASKIVARRIAHAVMVVGLEARISLVLERDVIELALVRAIHTEYANATIAAIAAKGASAAGGSGPWPTVLTDAVGRAAVAFIVADAGWRCGRRRRRRRRGRRRRERRRRGWVGHCLWLVINRYARSGSKYDGHRQSEGTQGALSGLASLPIQVREHGLRAHHTVDRGRSRVCARCSVGLVPYCHVSRVVDHTRRFGGWRRTRRSTVD